MDALLRPVVIANITPIKPNNAPEPPTLKWPRKLLKTYPPMPVTTYMKKNRAEPYCSSIYVPMSMSTQMLKIMCIKLP